MYWFSLCDSFWEVGRDSLCRPRLVLHTCSVLCLPDAGMAVVSRHAIGCSCSSISLGISPFSSLSHQLLGTFSGFFTSCISVFFSSGISIESLCCLCPPSGVSDLNETFTHSLVVFPLVTHVTAVRAVPNQVGPCLGYTVTWFPQCLVQPAFLIAFRMV